MMTRLKFREWVRMARTNARIVYYRGWLLEDRGPTDRHLKTDEQHDVCLLADAVQESFQKGHVQLFQKRTGEKTYDYYAIRV